MVLLKKLSKKARVASEYAVVFGLVSSATLFGAHQYIKPAVIKLMEKTGEMIEREAARLTRHYE